MELLAMLNRFMVQNAAEILHDTKHAYTRVYVYCAVAYTVAVKMLMLAKITLQKYFP